MEEHTTEKKRSFAGIYILLGIMLVCILASLAISVAALGVSAQMSEYFGIPVFSGSTKEDGVVIAGQYEIKSTKRISDAYKSQNTSGLSDKEKETLDMASEVLDLVITDTMNDFDKELAIYEWMTRELQNDSGLLVVIPTTKADCDNPYGVLKYHNAVCVGYATTFRLFMQMLDIPCMVVHETGLYHTWDLVKIDGHWYHTDIYSDAGQSNYANFNMNDDICAQSHDWDREFFPEADSLELNMMNKTAKPANNIYQIPAMISEAVDKGEYILSVKFDESLKESDAQAGEVMLDRINERLSANGDGTEICMYWSWTTVGDGYILAIYLEDYSESEESDLPEEVLEKIEEAVSEYFGESDYTDEWDWEDDYEFDENWDWDDYEADENN